MSGLVAILLGLTGVVYAVWPWLCRQAQPLAHGEPEVRAGEELESVVKALRDWSVAAGEIRVEELAAIDGKPHAEVGDE